MNWIFPQTSRGSFSAVSTPIFASKYSLESSRRDLHNALLCTVLQSQNFSQKSATFFREWVLNFRFFHFLRRILHFFLRMFDEILSGFRDKFRKRVTSVAFQSTLRKQIRKLPTILKSVNIIHYYSLLFIRVLRADTVSSVCGLNQNTTWFPSLILTWCWKSRARLFLARSSEASRARLLMRFWRSLCNLCSPHRVQSF